MPFLASALFPPKSSVSDPDPDWIRIQWGPWIRIRIRNPDPDPDPGARKWRFFQVFLLHFCLKPFSFLVYTVGAKTVDRAKTLDPDTLPIHFEHLKLSKQPDFFTC